MKSADQFFDLNDEFNRPIQGIQPIILDIFPIQVRPLSAHDKTLPIDEDENEELVNHHFSRVDWV